MKKSYTNNQIMRMDRDERLAKRNLNYQKKQPENVVSSLNQIADELNLILIEIRRMNDLLSYISPNIITKMVEEKKNEQQKNGVVKTTLKRI